MQPYVFPYIGYFSYIQATDKFMFYDDVQFIMRGWINRNRIALNGREHMITVPLLGASPNRNINETRVMESDWSIKALATIRQAYLRAPQFPAVFPLVTEVFTSDDRTIDKLAIRSVRAVCAYLGMKLPMATTSAEYGNQTLGRVERLVDLCRREGAEELVVPEGGRPLYDRQVFASAGIHLHFLKPREIPYFRGPRAPWIPWLSIIDVLMHLPPAEVRELLDQYDLD